MASYSGPVFVVAGGNSSAAVHLFGNPVEVETVSEPLFLQGEQGSRMCCLQDSDVADLSQPRRLVHFVVLVADFELELFLLLFEQ